LTHFSWTQFIPGVGHDYIHVATTAIVALFIISFSLLAYFQLKKSKESHIVSDKFSIKGFCEVLVEGIAGLVESVIGPHSRGYVPVFGALFVYILFNNLAGLFPGMTPATDNFNTTLSIGVFSFIMYNAVGIKEQGFVNYVKHFWGPVWWLGPLLLPIEIVSHLVRPMSLGLRLMGNMTGDHTVLSVFLDLTYVVIPVIFYCLGIFVCFLQAFIFTLLSMVYVSMARAHDH
jgi:F-type H+-transporting ATPase subunit a